MLIPARNEADVIEECLKSILAQDYPGALCVIVIDDHSEDGTSEAAARMAGKSGRQETVHVLRAAELPAGWAGKLWALNEAHRHAETLAPEATFLWLSDADIRHDPGILRRLVAKALSDDRDLVSLMADLRAEGFWGRLLVPPFVYFFQKLYPFRWAADPRKRTAAAAGGCVLLRREVFETAGGFSAIRSALIDDCALAALMKGQRGPKRGRIWLGLGKEISSLRTYRGLADIWDMVARSAYTQLRYSPLLLMGTLAGMVLTYVVPPLAIAFGIIFGDPLSGLMGLATWALMTASYLPSVALYRLPRSWALALPFAAAIYTMMTISSAWRHRSGGGARWKGRSHRGLAGARQGR